MLQEMWIFQHRPCVFIILYLRFWWAVFLHPNIFDDLFLVSISYRATSTYIYITWCRVLYTVESAGNRFCCRPAVENAPGYFLFSLFYITDDTFLLFHPMCPRCATLWNWIYICKPTIWNWPFQTILLLRFFKVFLIYITNWNEWFLRPKTLGNHPKW